MDIENYYSSKKQSFAETYEGPFTEYTRECGIRITENVYEIELPTGTKISGKVSEIVFDEEKGRYSLKLEDKGFLFVSKDRLFLNLSASDSYICTFLLHIYVEPTFSEKVTKEIEDAYSLNFKLYGELGANCIAKGIVVPGVDVGVVLKVFGSGYSVLMKQLVFDGKKVELAVWAYNDKYVVFEI